MPTQPVWTTPIERYIADECPGFVEHDHSKRLSYMHPALARSETNLCCEIFANLLIADKHHLGVMPHSTLPGGRPPWSTAMRAAFDVAVGQGLAYTSANAVSAAKATVAAAAATAATATATAAEGGREGSVSS